MLVSFRRSISNYNKDVLLLQNHLLLNFKVDECSGFNFFINV